jgi:hypothetical protein
MSTINISQLDLTEHISNMVKSNGGDMTPYECNVYMEMDFPMDQGRLDSVISGLKEGKTPPISVARQLGQRYSILNGRHRVAGSILLGRKTIEIR